MMSVSHKRILSLQKQIANKIFVRGRHVFMAIDNCDFQEDIPDRKKTPYMVQ